MRSMTFIGALTCFVLCGCAHNKTKQNEPQPSEQPKLLKPTVKKIWVPPEIRSGGREWVEGHFLYRVETETQWSR